MTKFIALEVSRIAEEIKQIHEKMRVLIDEDLDKQIKQLDSAWKSSSASSSCIKNIRKIKKESDRIIETSSEHMEKEINKVKTDFLNAELNNTL